MRDGVRYAPGVRQGALLVVAIQLAAGCSGIIDGGGSGGDDDGDGDADADGGGGGDGGGGVEGSSRYFPDGAWFHQDISSAPVRDDSDAITAWMVDYTSDVAGTGSYGWGTDNSEMRIDFSIVVTDAPDGTEKRSFETVEGYYYPPDCDHAPMPLPPGGAIERLQGSPVDLDGMEGYACDGFDDGADCHLLVFSPGESRLYEVYHATLEGETFRGGCQAIWDTAVVYGDTGRGAGCTSADAAGFPIAPLLFRPADLAAGEISHAIRFILPNPMIHDRTYVPPGSHSTASGGPAESVPYAALFRLRADYPVEELSPGAQVVARALQRYGMYLSDGGDLALTAENDLLLETSWDEVGLDSFSLTSLRATDFEIVDTGERVADDWNCQRTPITE